jgi:phosphoadenosine phosphosulfate reductase
MQTRPPISLFAEQYEQEAIERILKFASLAEKMGFEVALGFSGGKDSQVCYDLCLRSGIKFKAYYNVSFESNITKRFIKEHYPDVIFRKEHKFGFIENISKNHSSLLPTSEMAYCCKDYKHNPKYTDPAGIVGVRKSESLNRKNRTVFGIKNKTILKKNKPVIDEFFTTGCQSTGTQSEIQLKPILEWRDNDVWAYIYKYNLPINPEYKMGAKRIGCIVCPKANFSSNVIALKKSPKLVDAFIRAREKKASLDWNITNKKNQSFENDKVYYICCWLNHSFREFSKRQWREYEDFRTNYYNPIKLKESYNSTVPKEKESSI